MVTTKVTNVHLHPVSDTGLPPEATKVAPAFLAVVEVIVVVDHFDVVVNVVGLWDVGFGDDPRFWTRLRLLLLVGERGRRGFSKATKDNFGQFLRLTG